MAENGDPFSLPMYISSLTGKARSWARSIKRDIVALWLAARDPRVPILAKLVAGLVAAYALSPVDLIPDFIPVLGYLDDVILIPLGIVLAVRLVPANLMDEFRKSAVQQSKPISRLGLIFVICIWLAGGALFGLWLWNFFHRYP